jgi:hypothetical protein
VLLVGGHSGLSRRALIRQDTSSQASARSPERPRRATLASVTPTEPAHARGIMSAHRRGRQVAEPVLGENRRRPRVERRAGHGRAHRPKFLGKERRTTARHRARARRTSKFAPDHRRTPSRTGSPTGRHRNDRDSRQQSVVAQRIHRVDERDEPRRIVESGTSAPKAPCTWARIDPPIRLRRPPRSISTSRCPRRPGASGSRGRRRASRRP